MTLRPLAAGLLCTILLTACSGKSTRQTTSSLETTAPEQSQPKSDSVAASQEPPSPTLRPATSQPAPVNGLTATYSLQVNGNHTQVDVYVDGTKTSTMMNGNSDITTFMHKGANRVRVLWDVTVPGSAKITIGESYKGHWNTAANFSVDFENPKGDKTIVINGR